MVDIKISDSSTVIIPTSNKPFTVIVNVANDVQTNVPKKLETMSYFKNDKYLLLTMITPL